LNPVVQGGIVTVLFTDLGDNTEVWRNVAQDSGAAIPAWRGALALLLAEIGADNLSGIPRDNAWAPCLTLVSEGDRECAAETAAKALAAAESSGLDSLAARLRTLAS